MRRDNELTDVWELVTVGQDYNNKTGYYKTVDENYAYISGDQWRGVNANGLPTPVLNIIKRVRDYKVSSLMSSKVKGKYSVENINSDTEDPQELAVLELVEVMNNYINLKWDKEKMDAKLRECLSDGFAVGDFGLYTYWNSKTETGQYAQGDFTSEVFDGVNILLGNPNSTEIEKQPYIILLGRDTVENLKKEAKANGVNEMDIAKIMSDTGTEYTAGQYGKEELSSGKNKSNKTSYAIKLWKNEEGYVLYSKSTKYCDIKKEESTLLRRYPLAFGNWEKVKNAYHGRGDCTGMLPNQRYLNKQLAMIMLWMMHNALGKTAFDKTKIAGWSNQIGVAIPVNGDISGAIQQLQVGNLNQNVLEVLNLVINETLQSLGVNDVVLGDIKPENTSAIIAVQKQSAVPLENQQANMYQFVEDIYRIWGEYMVAYYTVDRQLMQESEEGDKYATYNGELLRDKLINVKIDVGSSSHWSEITELQTLDNLLTNQQISFVEYLERLPKGIISKKQDLIDSRKESQEIEGQEGQQEQAYEEAMQSMTPEQQEAFLQLPPEQQEAFFNEYMNQ